MQLSGETNNLDLYSDARKWCGIDLTDTTTLPLAEFVLSANFGLSRVNSLILRSDGKWQHNDENLSTELLDLTTNLVAETQKYAIKTTWLKIKKVRIKNQQGEFVTLQPVDREQLSDLQLRADSGDPKYYDKLGRFLYLYPKPNYSSTGGMEVQFQGDADLFAFDDTTKQPGFASQFHRLISLYGALDYCEQNDLEKRVGKILLKIGTPQLDGARGTGMEGELMAHYSDRDTDQKVGLRTRREDFGQNYSNSNSRNSGSNPDGFNFRI